MIPFAENKMWKVFLVRFRYNHCCVSVIMRPSDYFISPHLALGAIEFENPALQGLFQTAWNKIDANKWKRCFFPTNRMQQSTAQIHLKHIKRLTFFTWSTRIESATRIKALMRNGTLVTRKSVRCACQKSLKIMYFLNVRFLQIQICLESRWNAAILLCVGGSSQVLLVV